MSEAGHVAAGSRADPSPAADVGRPPASRLPAVVALGADVRSRPPSPIVTSCGRETGRRPCRPVGSSPAAARGTVAGIEAPGRVALGADVRSRPPSPIVTSCGHGTGSGPRRSSPGGIVTRWNREQVRASRLPAVVALGADVRSRPPSPRRSSPAADVRPAAGHVARWDRHQLQPVGRPPASRLPAAVPWVPMSEAGRRRRSSPAADVGPAAVRADRRPVGSSPGADVGPAAGHVARWDRHQVEP
jgi:hypothetical protein